MATRLHREEQTRINARTRDAFYPNQPFDPSPRSTSQAHATPSFVMPTPHGHTTSPIFPHHHPHTSPTYPSAPTPHDTTLGRHMMNGEIARNTGTPRGTWTAPTVHQPNDIPMQPMTEMTNVRTPRSPYYPETPTGGTNSGWGSPHGYITGRDAKHTWTTTRRSRVRCRRRKRRRVERGAYGRSVVGRRRRRRGAGGSVTGGGGRRFTPVRGSV